MKVCKGFSWVENALGFTAVRLHYSADPSKDIDNPNERVAEGAAKWLAEQRRNYPDPNIFAQEFELNWWIARGSRVYPEFSEEHHCIELEGYRPRKTIYRAWDFGWHAPACLIAQIDSKDRLVILKEIVGNQETTRDFAERVIDRCVGWFPDHTPGYTDYCDPAGQIRSPTASEKSEARDVEILNTLSIFPSWQYGWSKKDGRSLVHQLLALRSDGTPGLLVSADGCPVLLQGFLGKYVYAPRQGGQVHDEPDELNHPWADVMAALRYLATGLYSALGLRRIKYVTEPVRKADYHGYGTPKR